MCFHLDVINIKNKSEYRNIYNLEMYVIVLLIWDYSFKESVSIFIWSTHRMIWHDLYDSAHRTIELYLYEDAGELCLKLIKYLQIPIFWFVYFLKIKHICYSRQKNIYNSTLYYIILYTCVSTFSKYKTRLY